MISLQTDISYAGDPTKAPVETVDVSFQVPSFSYSGSSDSASGVTRRAGPEVQAGSISQKLISTNYSAALAEAFLTGTNDAASALAAAYELNAIQQGNLDALTVSVTAIYAVSGGHVLGQQIVDTLILPTAAASTDRMSMALVAGPAQTRPRYFAVNKRAYAALQQQLARTSIRGQDALILTALAVVTSLDGNAPTYLDAATDTIAKWIDKQTDNDDATTILATIKAALPALTNFPLTIPEVVALAIAGKLKILPPAGVTVSLYDFKALEVSAECPDAAGGTARVLTFHFDDRTTITGDGAAFSLATAADALFRNLVGNPIVVRVRADGDTLWTREYKNTDPTLATLKISVSLPAKTTLTAPPDGTRPESALKLRGRVVTFKKDCVLKDVLVLVQAKRTDDGAWRVVGAATTDASGNFGMPYPYGTYVQARALVSLAPPESVDIPIVAKNGDQTIADDFLYLLLNDPACPAPTTESECGCKDGKPNRLPDFSDLIESDDYTQDIGGSCVNLSKPNRTLSEFNFKGIVRLSDPDVALYTLTRIETGLDAIDPALTASLASGADAVKAALASAQKSAALVLQPLTDMAQRAVNAAYIHGGAVHAALSLASGGVDFSVLAAVENHVQAIIGIIEVARKTIKDSKPLSDLPDGDKVVRESKSLKEQIQLAIDTVGTAVRYELNGGRATRQRQPVALSNAILWQNSPEVSSTPQSLLALANTGVGAAVLAEFRGREFAGRLQPLRATGTPPPMGTEATTSFSQAVSVSTGHILHYKALFKADGYSMGDLLYSLPLAPGQKKQIVVIDATHTLVGTETQTISQNERLAMGLVDERDITSQLAGTLSESLRGSSTADTKGISAGFGTGGQGSGNVGAQGTGYGGSGSAVIGVAGGFAQATANAAQDSSREVAGFFREKLRQSIMQNAEGYRQLNASVVTTVQEGQRYGVTSEVVANHNHCHALTIMYFEVLRHYAIYQELSGVEECVLVPFLLTRFTTENIAKWRDVLAPALLPMPSDTYLQPSVVMTGGRQHPLIKAFDADQRIRNHYANCDYPEGSYDEELIQFLRGYARIRISLPRPRTRFDRILSLPITKQLDRGALAEAAVKFATDSARYAAKAAVTAGFSTLFAEPPPPPNPEQYQVLAREAIFDAFMSFDGNFESVPPAQCIRVKNFKPPNSIATGIPGVPVVALPGKTALDVFADNRSDREQWQGYADLLGYTDVETMLNAFFRGNLISEWDTIFNTDIAPLAFEKILDSLNFKEIALDWSADAKYRGGERLVTVNLAGTTAARRRDLPLLLHLGVSSAPLRALRPYVTFSIQDLRITYSTAHHNGVLYSGPVGDDLLDGTILPIPESAEDRRNPRREDRYLAARLIEHLNSNLEYYNKVLWRHLDPDRRFMLLDGFNIQVYDDDGKPIPGEAGNRSLATVIKNELVTVAGNSLVFPVAPGYRVSGNFVRVKPDGKKEAVTLFDHYKPPTPMEPYRVSVPTKGVFAEAVQGACNACEKIETERLQDWNRFPNTDEPTSISPIVTPTPTVTDWKAAFKDFAAPIVNVQNAPGLPAPGAGLAGLADLLGKAGIFKDITGLDATQQNALRTYLSNQENAKAFAEMAKEMAMQSHNTANSDKITEQIHSAKTKGAIDSAKENQLTADHLQQMIDGGATKKAELEQAKESTPSPLTQAAVDAVARGRKVKAQRSDADGSDERLDVGEPGPSAGEESAEDLGIIYVSSLDKAGEVATDIGMDIVKNIIDGYFKGTRVTIDQLKDGAALLHGYTDIDDYLEPPTNVLFDSVQMTVSIENLGGGSTMSGLTGTLEISWDDGLTLDPDKLKPAHRTKKPWLPYIQCKTRILVLPVKATAGMALDNAIVKLDLIATKPPIPTRVARKGLVMDGVEMIPTLAVAITLTPKYGGGDIIGTKLIPLSRFYHSRTVRIVNDSSGTGFDVIMPHVTVFPGPQFT